MWNGMKWEDEKEEIIDDLHKMCSRVSLSFFHVHYMTKSEILWSYMYMAKDWKKRQCSNICSTLHSLARCVLGSPCACLFRTIVRFLSAFLLLVLMIIQKYASYLNNDTQLVWVNRIYCCVKLTLNIVKESAKKSFIGSANCVLKNSKNVLNHGAGHSSNILLSFYTIAPLAP